MKGCKVKLYARHLYSLWAGKALYRITLDFVIIIYFVVSPEEPSHLVVHCLKQHSTSWLDATSLHNLSNDALIPLICYYVQECMINITI